MAVKLGALREKQKKLAAQIQLAEKAEQSKEKKREARRKFLIGDYMLKKHGQAGELQNLYEEVLPSVKRKSDRELFELRDVTEQSSD